MKLRLADTWMNLMALDVAGDPRRQADQHGPWAFTGVLLPTVRRSSAFWR